MAPSSPYNLYSRSLTWRGDCVDIFCPPPRHQQRRQRSAASWARLRRGRGGTPRLPALPPATATEGERERETLTTRKRHHCKADSAICTVCSPRGHTVTRSTPLRPASFRLSPHQSLKRRECNEHICLTTTTHLYPSTVESPAHRERVFPLSLIFLTSLAIVKTSQPHLIG